MIFTPFGEKFNHRRPRNAATIACANSGAIAPIMVMRAPATKPQALLPGDLSSVLPLETHRFPIVKVSTTP